MDRQLAATAAAAGLVVNVDVDVGAAVRDLDLLCDLFVLPLVLPIVSAWKKFREELKLQTKSESLPAKKPQKGRPELCESLPVFTSFKTSRKITLS